MAVDMSTAKGESRGKAYKEVENKCTQVASLSILEQNKKANYRLIWFIDKKCID